MQSDKLQRWGCAALVTLLVVAMAGGPQRSPDGMEMIAMVRGWFGEPTGVSPAYWPPLWPILAWTFGLGRWAEQAGYVLNTICAGGTAFFLYGLAARVGGPLVASVVTITFGLLPSIADQVTVLDARPLGWMLMAGTADRLAVARAEGHAKAWLIAGSVGFLAPLARPEGALPAACVVGLAAIGFVRSRPPFRAMPRDPRGWAAALAGAGVVTAIFLGRGRGWEGLALPWLGVWPTGDMLALYGFASAPTPYREWVLGSGVTAARFVVPAAGEFWAAIQEVLRAHVAAMGLGGVLLGAAGGVVLVRRSPAVLFALMVPIVFLALAPQRAGQLSLAANVTTFVPLWLAALAGVLTVLPRMLAPALAIGVVLAAHFEAAKTPHSAFVEGSAVAALTAHWLTANVPSQTEVACSFSSRAVVRDAGLHPVAVPSSFERWSPPEGRLLIVSSVDVRGNDAGTALAVADDRRWRLIEFFGEPFGPESGGHWFAVLQRGAP